MENENISETKTTTLLKDFTDEEKFIWNSKTKDDISYFKSLFKFTEVKEEPSYVERYVCSLKTCGIKGVFKNEKTSNFMRHLLRNHKDYTLDFILKPIEEKLKLRKMSSMYLFSNSNETLKRKITVDYLLSKETFNEKILNILLKGVPLSFFDDDD